MDLTPAERAWLDQHQSIKIAGPKAFPPFHFYDQEGKLQGIAVDYLFPILDRLNIKPIVQNPIPWPEVLEKAKSGDIDLIPCIAKTEDRVKFLDFSFPLIILTRKDTGFVGGLEDLHHKRLALVKGNSTISRLEQDKINFTPVYAGTPFEALRAVFLGKADAAIENLAAASYIIQQHGLINMKIAAPTRYENYDLYMAVKKGDQELLGIINKALTLLRMQKNQG